MVPWPGNNQGQRIDRLEQTTASNFDAGKRALTLLLVVMFLEGIAVFSNGAYFLRSMTICVISLWALSVAAVLNEKRLGLGSITMALPLALLAVLWVWTGLSMLWSITVANSWIEFNRTGGYLATFIIGLSVGRHRSVRIFAVYLFLLVTAAAASYALATKAAPSLVENLEHIDRLSVPIGYANGLGLFLALALPFTLYVATSTNTSVALRMASILIAPMILISWYFTLSRGVMIALIIGLLIYFIASPARQRSFYTLLLALVPTSIIAYWSSGQTALMEAGIDLPEKISAAESLRLYLIGTFAALVFSYWLVIKAERRIHIEPKVKNIIGILMLSFVISIMITTMTLFVSSKPSFSGWISQNYEEIFTPTNRNPGSDRLISLSLTGRYQIWKESITNWQKAPFTGSGAQSFSLVHTMLREDGKESVKDPHGLFFRLLTDLGLIGLVIGVAFIVSIVIVTIKLLHKVRDESDKNLIVAVLSMCLIYLVGTSFDWDWQLFAVTLPYFLFSGIIVAYYAAETTLFE